MSTQSQLTAHSALETKRKNIAQRLAGMIWHPSSIRRAFGSQDESTGPRSTLQPDSVFSNGASKGAAMLKEATRNWKVGACQIKHEATIPDPKDGCTMRFAILIPFSNGQERGQTSVPASVRIAGGRLYINNEQRTAEMARKASRGEHLSATDEAGMKRTAQFEDAPRASKGLEKMKSQKDAIVAKLDQIREAVESAADKARKNAYKKHGLTDEGYDSLESDVTDTLQQYAQELQKELDETKARVLRTSDGLLLTLDVRTKRNPKYESVMTFLSNFFSRANKWVDTLVARYTWMSNTMSAYETSDPKEMTKTLKRVDKNTTDLAKFKEDRGVADSRKRWQSDKIPPAVNSPSGSGPVEDRYASRIAQVESPGTVETNSGDIEEDFRDARDDVKAYNEMLGADEETAGSLADDQQLDQELPQPVTEVGDRVAHRNVMMLPFDSGRTAAQQPDPRLPFTDASTTPMAAFRRAKKAEASAPAPAKSKRQAMLDEGWSEAEVDAHLAGSK